MAVVTQGFDDWIGLRVSSCPSFAEGDRKRTVRHVYLIRRQVVAELASSNDVVRKDIRETHGVIIGSRCCQAGLQRRIQRLTCDYTRR